MLLEVDEIGWFV